MNTNYDESIGKESTVVKFYRNKLDLKLKEIKQIDTQIHKICENENYFVQMLYFEKAHGIKRDGYVKKSEMPDDAIDVDILMFEMGISDNKGELFTGKTYKKGYIKFPDNISEEDKKTYLELLNQAQIHCKQIQKLINKWEQLEKEYDTALEYYNMAKDGQIKKIDSQKHETQIYQNNQAIRESSNPYYKQYKELEQKYNTLRLKPNLTDKEASWATSKAGTFSATCSYTNASVKESGESDKGLNVSLGYSVPVYFINNLFKGSKKK